MANKASEMIVAATSDFLRRYPPFDRMEAEALRFMAERVRLAYHAKDESIVSPASGVVRTLYVIQRGKVLVRQSSEASGAEQGGMTLGPGESFPIGALVGKRPTASEYAVLEDLFCYELAESDFFDLLRRSPVFNFFCTEYISSLLQQSRRQLQVQYAQRAAEQQTMNMALADIVKKQPVSVTSDTPIRAVTEIMAERHIGSMVVVDGESRPIGIFTQSDVLKRLLLPGHPLASPIREVMSPHPLVLPLTANVHDAVLLMATHSVRHVLAVDDGGRLKGVISERDLFSLQRVGLRQVRQAIDSAAGIEGLRQAAADVRDLAFNLLAQGVGAEQLTRFVSALNDRLTQRVISLNLERHDLEGIEWAWLSFGSEGRGEQTFSTDQDNGIIFTCTDMQDRDMLQLRLLDFARDVNKDLDSLGFPLCQGNIMAGNPELCLTLEGWQAKFSDWVGAPTAKALLNATIFFDFRPLFGARHLADQLRLFLDRIAPKHQVFLRLQAQNALEVAPPLGRIRDFITDADPEHPGTIDLKKFGARIFVDAARIFSLACGLSAGGTVQRLRLAAPATGIPADETAAYVEAFHFIQILRLRRQHFETGQGRPGDNLIPPDQLNALDRLILKESFRQARKLQQRLKLDYQV